jgi:hypothetical protein
LEGTNKNIQMKKNVFNTVLLVVFLAVISCNEAKKEEQKMEEPVVTETQTTATQETTATEEAALAPYQCPMKCEQEKSYAEKGNCPVCKMELKELAAADMETGHDKSVH